MWWDGGRCGGAGSTRTYQVLLVSRESRYLGSALVPDGGVPYDI